MQKAKDYKFTLSDNIKLQKEWGKIREKVTWKVDERYREMINE